MIGSFTVRFFGVTTLVVALLSSPPARADARTQEPPAEPEPAGSPPPPATPSPPAPAALPEPPPPPRAPAEPAAALPPTLSQAEGASPGLKVTPTGYVEAYYAWNFNRPQNGITNYRGFDNRHDSFTLQNVALGTNFESGPVGGRIILQVGALPSASYAAEPTLPGARGANATSGELWKYLQEAYVTYKAKVARGVLLQLGLAASPIGYEVYAVKDNWNWSRSNLFYGLPYYHTGLRATYEWTDELSTTVGVFNGWNSVVDDNEDKSIQASAVYKIKDKLLVQALYFGGVERAPGAPEGPYWRHHVDAFGQYDATRWLSIAGEADVGWEPNRLGTATWAAGALYTRLRPVRYLYVALRGDRFQENLAARDGALSAPIFWGGASWVSSGTATLDVRPNEQASIRLEARHDAADAPLYFGRDVRGTGAPASPYVANARTQDTLLLGATAWF